MSKNNIPLDLSDETSGKTNSKNQPKGDGDNSEVQNLNQNHLTEQGNETKGNTPGGNFDEVRHTQANKPRSNPQGNAPMSQDKTNAEKGPGSKAD